MLVVQLGGASGADELAHRQIAENRCYNLQCVVREVGEVMVLVVPLCKSVVPAGINNSWVGGGGWGVRCSYLVILVLVYRCSVVQEVMGEEEEVVHFRLQLVVVRCHLYHVAERKGTAMVFVLRRVAIHCSHLSAVTEGVREVPLF